jgi:NADH:ubiquinone oxidoreductase subunit 5 (subunit L)/multisubunit Na+/H+ antiporter MnhA subunit
MSVILILLLPLIATALVCIPFKKYWASGVTVVSSVATLILAARIALQVAAGNLRHLRAQVGLLKWIAVDGLSALILLLIAFVATTAAIYSVGYMAHEN